MSKKRTYDQYSEFSQFPFSTNKLNGTTYDNSQSHAVMLKNAENFKGLTPIFIAVPEKPAIQNGARIQYNNFMNFYQVNEVLARNAKTDKHDPEVNPKLVARMYPCLGILTTGGSVSAATGRLIEGIQPKDVKISGRNTLRGFLEPLPVNKRWTPGVGKHLFVVYVQRKRDNKYAVQIELRVLENAYPSVTDIWEMKDSEIKDGEFPHVRHLAMLGYYRNVNNSKDAGETDLYLQ
jgi:hypothetical protein